MTTILGPIRGVQRSEPPALRLWIVSGGWKVVLAQWVLTQQHGWEILTAPSADTNVYAAKSDAQAALELLAKQETQG